MTCSDDERAEELARGLIASTPGVHAIETWLRPRLVCRLSGAAAASDPASLKMGRR